MSAACQDRQMGVNTCLFRVFIRWSGAALPSKLHLLVGNGMSRA